MKLKPGSMAVAMVTCLCVAHPGAVNAQWYVNQNGAGGNAMNYATNSLLYGNGLIPGTNLFPGNGLVTSNGIVPGQSADTQSANTTADSGDSADGGASGGGGGAYGYGFTSDPVSAYTNAVYSGMANVIRSEGSYNRQTARGMIDYEKARQLYADNQIRVLNTRRAIYRIRLAARIEDLELQHASLARANAFIAAHRPQPLDSPHLEASTGTIKWPVILLSPDFDDLRKQVDADFAGRASQGYDPDASIEIKKHVRELRDRLHEEILKHPLENYSQARQFLDQLLASAE